MMLKTQFNKFYKQRMNYKWAEDTADILLPLLPATLKTLMRKTGYSSTSVEKFLNALRRRKLIYTIRAGKKFTYERRPND